MALPSARDFKRESVFKGIELVEKITPVQARGIPDFARRMLTPSGIQGLMKHHHSELMSIMRGSPLFVCVAFSSEEPLSAWCNGEGRYVFQDEQGGTIYRLWLPESIFQNGEAHKNHPIVYGKGAYSIVQKGREFTIAPHTNDPEYLRGFFIARNVPVKHGTHYEFDGLPLGGHTNGAHVEAALTLREHRKLGAVLRTEKDRGNHFEFGANLSHMASILIHSAEK